MEDTSSSDLCLICPAIFDGPLSRFSLTCRLCTKEITSAKQVLDHKCSVRESRERKRKQSGPDVGTKHSLHRSVCREKDLQDHYRICHKVVVTREEDDDDDDDCQPLARRRKKRMDTIGKKDVSRKSSFYCHLCRTNLLCQPSSSVDDVEEHFVEIRVEKTTTPDIETRLKGEETSSGEVKDELIFEEEDVDFTLISQETKDPPEFIMEKEEETVGEDAFETEEDYLEDFADGDFYEEQVEEEKTENPEDRFKCDRCNRIYKKRTSLDRHIEEVHDRTEEDHVCKLCQKTLKTANCLRVHIKFVHATDTIKCHRCDYTSTFNELTQHVLNVHNGRRKKDRAAEVTPSVCHLCQKVLKNDHCLISHLRDVHSTERATCEQCQATFKNFRIMREHVLRVHKKKNAARARRCMNLGRRIEAAQLAVQADDEKCVVVKVEENDDDNVAVPEPLLVEDQGFTEQVPEDKEECQETLDSSIILEHSPEEKLQEATSSTECVAKEVADQSVKCRQCGESFCDGETCDEILVVKYDLQPGKKAVPKVKCPHCKFWSSRSKVSLHVQKVHEKKKVYICPSCGKELKTYAGLKIHTQAAHPTDDASSSNICETCGGIFASRQCLKDHIKILHRANDDVMKKCPECDYVAARPYLIRLHVRRVHEKIKSPNNNKVVCQICGVTVCDKKFLAGHIKSKHEGEIVMDEKTGKRIFPCKICGQKCGNRHGLTMHMAVKHGVAKLKKRGGRGRGGRPTHAEIRRRKEGEGKGDESILSESADAVMS